jgi:hypothetical protein
MRLTVIAVGLLIALCSGCESTQDTSARLKREAKKLANVKGLTVATLNPNVKVVSTTALHDANGTAAVVGLRDTSPRPLASLPISIALLDSAGRVLFRNDAPGIEQSLAQVPLLTPGTVSYWVNDQILGASDPHSVQARVGQAQQTVTGALPKMVLSGVQLTNDPTSGAEVVGTISNPSKITQLRLVIYCVVRRGGRIVAAGRAIIPNLPPAPTPKPVQFTAFFIGDPRGGQLELSAPPTVLK